MTDLANIREYSLINPKPYFWRIKGHLVRQCFSVSSTFGLTNILFLILINIEIFVSKNIYNNLA